MQPLNNMTQEAQLAVLSFQMKSVVEKLDSIAGQHTEYLKMARSVAVHDEQIVKVGGRLEQVERRVNEHSDNVMNQLHNISQQITESGRDNDSRNAKAIQAVNDRLDSHSEQIDELTAIASEAKGAQRMFAWLAGGLVTLCLLALSWAFTQISVSHDDIIRHDQRITTIEDMESKEHGSLANGVKH